MYSLYSHEAVSGNWDLAFLSVVHCHARLGETLDQCIARYDSPIKTYSNGKAGGLNESYARFAKSGFFVEVIFLEGKSESETFYKFDYSEIFESEQNILLEANAGNGSWSRSKEPSAEPIWLRNDGAIAGYKIFEHKLILFSKKFKEMSESENDAKLKAF